MAFKSKDLTVNLGPQRGGDQTDEDCPYYWLSTTNSLFCMQLCPPMYISTTGNLNAQNFCFPFLLTTTNPTGLISPQICGVTWMTTTTTPIYMSPVANDPEGAAGLLAMLKEQLRKTLAAVEKQEDVLAQGRPVRPTGAAKRRKAVAKRRKRK